MPLTGTQYGIASYSRSNWWENCPKKRHLWDFTGKASNAKFCISFPILCFKTAIKNILPMYLFKSALNYSNNTSENQSIHGTVHVHFVQEQIIPRNALLIFRTIVPSLPILLKVPTYQSSALASTLPTCWVSLQSVLRNPS